MIKLFKQFESALLWGVIAVVSYVNYQQQLRIGELQQEIWQTQDAFTEYIEGKSAPGVVKL